MRVSFLAFYLLYSFIELTPLRLPVERSLLSEADDALSFRQLRPSRIIGGGDMDDQCM